MPDALRVALVAPPPTTVPPERLGGEQVCWLAGGLAAAGHHVTLIGAGPGAPAARYAMADTGASRLEGATPELVDRLHAAEAGRILEQLQVDVVGDHSARGYRPASGRRLLTVRTLYRRLSLRAGQACATPLHIGLVAVSDHQRRRAADRAWLGTIHPAVPVAGRPLARHDGPCLYLGPLTPGHGARVALAAAHQAGRPITLVGTEPGTDADAYAEVHLLPRLGPGDRLHAWLPPARRDELLARARCLVAPLRHDAAYSPEIVAALARGTPVVGLRGTVAGELVEYGASGLLVLDPADLPAAIAGTDRLDPEEVRAHAARRFDVPVMAAAYERLFARLLGRRDAGLVASRP